MGPRPAGTAANDKLRAMVAAHFKKAGATITEQPFKGVDPLSGQKVQMYNLIGAWHPERACFRHRLVCRRTTTGRLSMGTPRRWAAGHSTR